MVERATQWLRQLTTEQRRAFAAGRRMPLEALLDARRRELNRLAGEKSGARIRRLYAAGQCTPLRAHDRDPEYRRRLGERLRRQQSTRTRLAASARPQENRGLLGRDQVVRSHPVAYAATA
jgi:hypothetical protein